MKIEILDATMREFAGHDGRGMTAGEKFGLAEALKRAKVDTIETGFPVASPEDFRTTQDIARLALDTRIAALTLCRKQYIERTAEAVRPAKRNRIHVFQTTQSFLGKFSHSRPQTKEEMIDQVVEAVRAARNHTDDVEFSLENPSAIPSVVLNETTDRAIDAGATTINIADSTGKLVAEDIVRIIRTLRNGVPNLDKAILSIHCHGTIPGQAAANSVAAVQEGAQQVECTVNGVGPDTFLPDHYNLVIDEQVLPMRASENCPLEEIVRTFKSDNSLRQYDVGVNEEGMLAAVQEMQRIVQAHEGRGRRMQ